MIADYILKQIHEVQRTSYNRGAKGNTDGWWPEHTEQNKALLTLCETLQREENCWRSQVERKDAELVTVRVRLRKAQRQARKARKT